MLLVLATLQEYVRMVAVETVGQLTLEVPRPKRSSGEQQDPIRFLRWPFWLVNIWVLCAVVPCVSWKHTNFCMCQTAAGTSEVWCVCSEKIQVTRWFFPRWWSCVYFFCWERLDLPVCLKKNTGTFWAGSWYFLSGQTWLKTTQC